MRAAESERETFELKVGRFYRGRVGGERRKIGAALERCEVADNLRVGGSVAAKRDNCSGLRIGNAATHEFQQSQFAHARVFQVGKGCAGKNRLSCRAMARDFEKNGIRQARKTHGLQLTRAQSKLVQPGKLEDRVFADLRPDQARDIVARVERLAASSINLQHGNTAGVGKSG